MSLFYLDLGLDLDLQDDTVQNIPSSVLLLHLTITSNLVHTDPTINMKIGVGIVGILITVVLHDQMKISAISGIPAPTCVDRELHPPTRPLPLHKLKEKIY